MIEILPERISKAQMSDPSVLLRFRCSAVFLITLQCLSEGTGPRNGLRE